ncbi:helix-turn-helix domain-containing protein [Micromonospora sp. WMMD882]|uniref:helix-turn-helix domain-containing protein n=1 Tax=Micromonospora sp. WMMD882 TaxID=3015151 RepID=UPI00248CEF21|nr:helix-turn-helix domain-containing protein [Micromonospora sp. WMMD882]WBB77703.1 helix-turn-helix domain-containing protein [Micromonospora sp. WMMD882]
MDDVRRNLGWQLARRRNAVGLRQVDLAKLIRYSRSAIAGVEAGRDNTTRIFWHNADVALGAHGALLALFDQLDALMRSLHAQKARARDQKRQQFGLPPAPLIPENAAGPAACAGCGPVVVGRWTGREVRALRAALRMSVDGFAEHLGVDPATVHGWEHQRAVPPTLAAQSVLDRVLTLAHSDVKARFRLLLDTPDDSASWALGGQDAHAGSTLAIPVLPAGRTCPASWHPPTAEATRGRRRP